MCPHLFSRASNSACAVVKHTLSIFTNTHSAVDDDHPTESGLTLPPPTFVSLLTEIAEGTGYHVFRLLDVTGPTHVLTFVGVEATSVSLCKACLFRKYSAILKILKVHRVTFTKLCSHTQESLAHSRASVGPFNQQREMPALSKLVFCVNVEFTVTKRVAQHISIKGCFIKLGIYP